MEQAYKYEAFISYRHTLPDAAVAKRLHTLIETFAVPGHIRAATGRQKMGRVFRDEEELPLSSDLGADIQKALEQSRWLIVICSPRLLQSVWCMTEIDSFIALGRQDHILTVLVEGEPEDSFPPQLRFARVDGEKVEKEPLAANVRGAGTGEILKKLAREKLRILAPMLGVDYDTLRQRARARRLRIIAGATAAAFVLLSSFLVYAVVQNRRIAAQRAQAMEGQSLYLADFSERALAGGDRMLALLLALEGLPQDPENPDRPVVEKTVSALRSAIISQGGVNSYTQVTTIFQNDIKAWRAAGDELALYSSKAQGFLRFFDLTNGQETTARKDFAAERELMENETPKRVWFSSTLLPRILYTDKAYFKNSSLSGFEALPQRDDWAATEAVGDFSTALLYAKYENRFFVKCRFYDGLLMEQDVIGSLLHAAPVWGSENAFVVGGYMNDDKADDGPVAMTIQAPLGQDWEVLHRYGGIVKKGSVTPCVNQVGTSSRGDAVMGRSWNEVYVWNAATEELVHTLTAEALGGFSPVYAAFTPGQEPWLAVLTDGGTPLLLNYVTGEPAVALDMGMARAVTVQWSADGTRLLCACEDGSARLWRAATGELLQTLPATGALEEASFAQTAPEGCSANDNYIVLRGRDFLDIYAISAQGEEDATGSLIPLPGFNGQNIQAASFSSDGASLWILGEDTSQGDMLYAFDAVTGERLAAFENECRNVMPQGEHEILTWETSVYADDAARLFVYDAVTATQKAVLTPAYPHASKEGRRPDDYFNIGGITASEDGRYLLFNAGYSATNRVEACVFVYDAQTWEELWHFGLYDPGNPAEYIFPCAAGWGKPCNSIVSRFTADGRYVISQYTYGYSAYVVEARRTLDGVRVCATPFYPREAALLPPVYDPDGAAVYTGAQGDTTLRRVSTLTGETLNTIALPGPVTAAEYYPAEGHLRITVTGENGDTVFCYWKPAMDGALSYTPAADGTGRESDNDATTASKVRNTDKAGPEEAANYRGIFNTEKELSPYKSQRTIWGSILYGDEWCLLSDFCLKGTFTGDTKAVLGTAESKVCVYAGARDGSALLVQNSREGVFPRILRYADLPGLMATARTILDGRTLTPEELEKYYISTGA